jgi:2-polyprenyl-3-methyl-5-hydroxy-6-metoxy-1,4-benzoquinol methylase
MRQVDHCPACGVGATTVELVLDEVRRQRFLDFSLRKYGGLLERWLDDVPPVVMRCVSCGHHWYRHQPDPQQLSQMYAAGRPLGGASRPTREASPAMLAQMRRVRRMLAVSGHRPTLLDFGSGLGRWARAAVKAGFDVVAFEPSEARGAEADTPFELVHRLDALAGRKFDAIVLEQVLEHVLDPLDTLTTLRHLCRDSTLVHISVPNILRDPAGASVWSTWPFDGETPHVLAPFEHLHGFTPRSLQALTLRAGFRSLPPSALAVHVPMLFARRLAACLAAKLGATEQYLHPRQH